MRGRRRTWPGLALRAGARVGRLAAGALALVVGGCSLISPEAPLDPTLVVAGTTDAPTPSPARRTAVASVAPTMPAPSLDPGPTAPAPSLDPGPTEPPPGIVPGEVDRSSYRLTATYDVNALIAVATGALEMATLIQVRNDSGEDIDRLELNTIAAQVGKLRLARVSVDDVRVKARVEGQTIQVPLGGILRDGASTTIRIEHRARLADDLSGSNWMFTRAGGTLALHRWIPWLSRAVPFGNAEHGEPFVTPTSPRVDVEIVADRPLILASPAAEVEAVPAGAGRAWSFSMRDVRDVSVVLSSFDVLRGEAAGVPIRVYTRSGALAAERLLALAEQAVREQTRLLGVDYPWPVLSVVETQAGDALETPGLVWMPQTADSVNRTYLVHHEIAQQWFYGLVGNDQHAQPFADEGIADLVARTVLRSFRSSRCAAAPLDRPMTAYAGTCYYEVVFVQSGLFLDEVRRRMGTQRFWGAIRAYIEANRHGMGSTRELLDALVEASDVDITPLLRQRFPRLY